MLEGKKVLLTGLTGRIGGAIAARFAPTCELWGLARYSAEGSMEAAEKQGVIPVKGDFASGALDGVPTDFDYVLHVAADVYMKTAEEGMAANSDGPAYLMKHCRRARAFLHVSTTGVYARNPDPRAIYPETADLGGFENGHQYAPTKLAGEGAVRAGAIILGLPTVICRQNVQYGGPHKKPGRIDRHLDIFVETGEVFLPPEGPLISGAIHEDDICDLVEPCLSIASVPAEIVNWSGDEAVDSQEMFEYAGRLLGKTPKIVRSAAFAQPTCIPDTTKRMRIAGPCKVSWKAGVRRTLALRHPGIKLNDVA